MHGDPSLRSVCSLHEECAERRSHQRQSKGVSLSTAIEGCALSNERRSIHGDQRVRRSQSKGAAIPSKGAAIPSMAIKGCGDPIKAAILSHCDPNQSKGVSQRSKGVSLCDLSPWQCILTNQRVCSLPGRSKGVLSPINDARRSLSPTEIEGCATAIPHGDPINDTSKGEPSPMNDARQPHEQSAMNGDPYCDPSLRSSTAIPAIKGCLMRSLMHRDPLNGNQRACLSRSLTAAIEGCAIDAR